MDVTGTISGWEILAMGAWMSLSITLIGFLFGEKTAPPVPPSPPVNRKRAR